MQVLGLSCFYHDSAACLVRDGEIIGAGEEERFTRTKHDNFFPTKSVEYVLQKGGISGKDLDAVVFYEKPLTKLERVFQIAKAYPEQSQDHLGWQMTHYANASLQLPDMVSRACGYQGAISYCDHHLSHAASAFFSSPFEESAILTVDGVGEWATTGV